jgi:uncharacterized membrane protein YadS
LVKLVRVLMLGPVVAGIGFLAARSGGAVHHVGLKQFFPWFILVFIALASMRSLGLLPLAFIEPARACGNLLTIVAMAGLGLGVDIRYVAAAGVRVSVTVAASLLLLGVLALCVISSVHI